jgi:hypothetical protein
MGEFVPGDVVIAPVRFEEGTGVKVRPVVVIQSSEGGLLTVCPVSTRDASDQITLPLSLDDFLEGGLDMFGESYVYPAKTRQIRSRDIIGKRGRLTKDALYGITGKISGKPTGKKKQG